MTHVTYYRKYQSDCLFRPRYIKRDKYSFTILEIESICCSTSTKKGSFMRWPIFVKDRLSSGITRYFRAKLYRGSLNKYILQSSKTLFYAPEEEMRTTEGV